MYLELKSSFPVSSKCQRTNGKALQLSTPEHI